MNSSEEYSFDDLIVNESFQNWVAGNATEEENNYWKNWVSTHPNQKASVDEAVALLRKFEGITEKEDATRIEGSWRTLKGRIDRDQVHTGRSVPFTRHKNVWLKYAAAVTVLLVSVLAYYQFANQPEWITYSSDFGEKKEIELEDGTLVTLNANSKFKISADGFDRQVILEQGEAFFNVTKTSQKDQFVVHAAGVDIQVLGTEFNVNLRGQGTDVMLREGKVKLLLNDGRSAVMKPGELATLNPQGQFNIASIETSDYDAWLSNKIVFDNTRLSKIAELIETHYGVEVILDSTLHNRKLSGVIPNDNLDLLLNALKVTHDLEITNAEDAIKISQ